MLFVFLFFVFLFFLVFWFFGFLVFWFFGLCVDSLRTQKKTKKTKSCRHGSANCLGCPRGFGTNCKKPKKPKNQKTRNQKTKKPKKTKKPRLHTPRGGGQMQSVGSCLFVFFFFLFFFFWFFGFLVFCFFGFLVCVWIAIADVPSRDCQALSVVALEARSIHYSTAMFAMT